MKVYLSGERGAASVSDTEAALLLIYRRAAVTGLNASKTSIENRVRNPKDPPAPLELEEALLLDDEDELLLDDEDELLLDEDDELLDEEDELLDEEDELLLELLLPLSDGGLPL